MLTEIQIRRIKELKPAIEAVRTAARSECDELTNLVRIGRTSETYEIAVIGISHGKKVVISAHLPKITANKASVADTNYSHVEDYRGSLDHLQGAGFVEVA